MDDSRRPSDKCIDRPDFHHTLPDNHTAPPDLERDPIAGLYRIALPTKEATE